MFEFLRRRPQDVLTAFALQHMFASVQLEWLSCRVESFLEETDSEAEEDRCERPVFLSLEPSIESDYQEHAPAALA